MGSAVRRQQRGRLAGSEEGRPQIQPLRAAVVTLAVVVLPAGPPASHRVSERLVSEQQRRHHLRRHHHHYYSADDGPIRSISAVPLCKCPSGGPDADPPRSKPNRRRRLRPRTTVAASAVIACRREIHKIYCSISLIAGSSSVQPSRFGVVVFLDNNNTNYY